jgi:membrane-associated phospholipid phosphatase
VASDPGLHAGTDWPLTRRLLWVGVPAMLLLAAVLMHPGEPDASLFLAINAAAAHLPDALWAGLTNLGQTGILFALLSPMLLLRPRWVMSAVCAIPFGALYSYGAKALFDAPRPAGVLEAGQFHMVGHLLTSHSFPSGHAITAFAAAAAILAARGRRAAWWPVPLVLLLAGLVGLSRIAVGAHWPLDILAGAAGGWLSGLCGYRLSARYPALWQNRRWRHGLGVVLALVALSLLRVDTGYPQALALQWLAIGCAWATCLWQLLLLVREAAAARTSR